MKHDPIKPAFMVAALLALSACDKPKIRDAAAPAAPAADSQAGAKDVTDPGGTPPAPVWVRALIGKDLKTAFPNVGACKGNTDILQRRYAGDPAGVQIHGWGWDLTRKVRIKRVVLVDETSRIVGGGEGGLPRPDVPLALPDVTDGATGWNADIPVTKGPLGTFGVTGPDSLCVLGRIAF